MNKDNFHVSILFVFIFSLFFSSTLQAKEYLSPAELEKWFNSDDELPTSKVNDGQLIFLKSNAKKNIFHSVINIFIGQNSLDNGWTRLTQCYSNLDPIHRTAVVYRKNLIKNLKVLSSRNIKFANVSGNKVLLKDVTKDATLCIGANARNFYQNEDKSFSLVNGPYHRKFLDGYYPYHLKLNIHYIPKLKFNYGTPKQQPGFQVNQDSNSLSIDTLFKGRLKTEFRFNLIN
jgi:hypothetical protein